MFLARYGSISANSWHPPKCENLTTSSDSKHSARTIVYKKILLTLVCSLGIVDHSEHPIKLNRQASEICQECNDNVRYRARTLANLNSSNSSFTGWVLRIILSIQSNSCCMRQRSRDNVEITGTVPGHLKNISFQALFLLLHSMDQPEPPIKLLESARGLATVP